MFAVALSDPQDEAKARQVRYGLVDLSAVTDMQVTPTHIHQFVEIQHKMAALTPNGIVAVVAPHDLTYALSRLWHTLSYDLGWISNVFHSRRDAIAWLRMELLIQDNSDPELSQFPSLKLD